MNIENNDRKEPVLDNEDEQALSEDFVDITDDFLDDFNDSLSEDEKEQTDSDATEDIEQVDEGSDLDESDAEANEDLDDESEFDDEDSEEGDESSFDAESEDSGKSSLFSKKNLVMAGTGVIAVGIALGANSLVDSWLGKSKKQAAAPSVAISAPKDVDVSSLPKDPFAASQASVQSKEPVQVTPAPEPVVEQQLSEQDMDLADPPVEVSVDSQADRPGEIEPQSIVTSSPPVASSEKALFSSVIDNTREIAKHEVKISENTQRLEKLERLLSDIQSDFDKKNAEIKAAFKEISERLESLKTEGAQKPEPKKEVAKVAAKPKPKPKAPVVNRAAAKKETAKKVAQSAAPKPPTKSVSGKAAPAPKEKPSAVAAKPASPIKGFAVVATYPANAGKSVPAQKAWITNGAQLLEVKPGSSIGSARVTSISGLNVLTTVGTISPIR